MERFFSHMDRLIEQRPASRNALSALRDLLSVNSGTPTFDMKAADREVVGIKQKEGFPLFSAIEELPLDLDHVSQLFRGYLAHLVDTDRPDREAIRDALNRMIAEPGWLGDILQACYRPDEETWKEVIGEVPLEPAVLQFLGHWALRPSLLRLREKVAGWLAKDQWEQGYCPVCASQPCIAYFDSSGSRFLHCGFCGEEWPFPRIRCPFCENEDRETLGYFEAEEEEGFRVDFCRKCNRYLKTVDRRAFEKSTPMELENLATLHLDLIAMKEGFTGGMSYSGSE